MEDKAYLSIEYEGTFENLKRFLGEKGFESVKQSGNKNVAYVEMDADVEESVRFFQGYDYETGKVVDISTIDSKKYYQSDKNNLPLEINLYSKKFPLPKNDPFKFIISKNYLSYFFLLVVLLIFMGVV